MGADLHDSQHLEAAPAGDGLKRGQAPWFLFKTAPEAGHWAADLADEGCWLLFQTPELDPR